LLKDNEFNYNWIIGDTAKSYGWMLFIPVVILVIISVSNGANMTDGLDGLATGTSGIIAIALAVLAYVSGHIEFADYLNVMYIPDSAELVIFIAAFMGACIGFLVVQLVSGASIHGRYGKFSHWRNHCRICNL
jgi:phospho-N-acetylmuramoyl-pentapeptide-transferase